MTEEFLSTNGGTLSGDVAVDKGFGYYSKIGSHKNNGATFQIASDDNSKYAFLALRTDGTITFSRNGYGETSGTFNLFGEHNTDLLATRIQNIIQGGNVSMVRHIQRGTATIGSAYEKGSSIDIALNGFTNIDKMVVSFDGVGSYNGSSYDSSYAIVCGPYLSSLSTTSMRVRTPNSTTTFTFSYQVIEYY